MITGRRLTAWFPRLRLAGLAVAVSLTVAGFTTPPAAAPAADSERSYCAELPDAIGLYEGNPVTQMGFQIGTVDRIRPAGVAGVRVDFTVSERALPADVRTIIRSTSVLADRSLEIVGNYRGGPRLRSDSCVSLDRAATPRSISQSVGSAATLIDGITPEESQNIRGTIAGLEKLLRGRGGDINSLLTESSALLDSPDRSIADIGSIVVNVANLTTMLSAQTGPLKQIITAMPTTTPNVTEALWGTADLIDALPEIIILVDDLERRLGGETQAVLDVLPSAIHLAAGRAQDIASLLDPLPGLIGMIGESTRTGTGFRVAYRPPSVRLQTPDAAALCRSLNTRLPGGCHTVAGQPRVADVAVIQWVLAGGTLR